MTENQVAHDPHIGITINDYELTAKVGWGRIGSVYKAIRSSPQDTLACKVIQQEKLKQGWEREIEKVIRLRGVPNIVQYHAHGTKLDKNSRPFVWILWDFVAGINLRDYMKDLPWSLDLAFIESIDKTVLEVLHACRAVDIQHGDLHEGNILISNPDSRFPGGPRRILISDFGYGGSHNELDPKNDYKQLFSITSALLKRMNVSELNPRDKVLYRKINEFSKKRMLEVDPTQTGYAGYSEKLIQDYSRLAAEAEIEAAAAAKGEEIKGTGDYLWAEAIGNRSDEWKTLFVPEFLAAQDLLSKNITILTGARGCGKTMVFRRLTAFMDKVIGESSGVKGSDQFVGFYVNCRDLVEAFPWLPKILKTGMKEQILHYFHLTWFSDICKTLALYRVDAKESFSWLDKFLTNIFDNKYNPLPLGSDSLAHARAFLEDQKEICRLSNLGKLSGLNNWPLARMDSLDILQDQIERHVPWIGQTPIYLFLDDYTIPIVTREVQIILNPIIFKRRSKLFFKISTESTNSFERGSLRRKPLELHQDFELIDLASESLHQDPSAKSTLVNSIFRPRIKRHDLFNEKNYSLVDILGKTATSNNELARLMRKNSQEGNSKRVYYSGEQAFVGMWSSDIRIMIQMFTDMLRDADGQIKENGIPIPKEIQDKIYRATGGEFLEFLGAVVEPALWERGPTSTKPGEKYGTHLKDIVEAFVRVSRYELTEGGLVSNQGRENPKQAFRLEIIDKFDLSKPAMSFFEGLVRWHIFLQDWRGKSIRGMLTPRLYLNRILLPFCNLTFSSHDHIQITNEEFISLLTKPSGFFEDWKKKRKKEKKTDERQGSLW
jgi:serine/threonine protein kinase